MCYEYLPFSCIPRYVGPFIKTIREWEQNLSLVSEIIDVWSSTQSKWLHLEGIFIGGDAREKLPVVAKKFDEIDVAYRTVFPPVFFAFLSFRYHIIIRQLSLLS